MAATTQGRSASSVTATSIAKHRDRAFKQVMDALAADETGKSQPALDAYMRAAHHLEAGVSYPIADLSAESLAHMTEMQTTLSRVNARVIALQQEMTPLELSDLPEVPEHEPQMRTVRPQRPPRPPPPATISPDATRPAQAGLLSSVVGAVTEKVKAVAALGGDGQSYKFGDITRGLVNMVRSSEAIGSHSTGPPRLVDSAGVQVDAQVLLNVVRGVKLFDITSSDLQQVSTDGNVRLVTSSAPLQALAADDVTFLQCSNWIFPLVSAEACLRLRPRLYVFPNERNQEALEEEDRGVSADRCSGQWVGIMLTQLVSEEAVTQFEEILAYFCDFRQVEIPEDERALAQRHEDTWGTKVAGTIETGADYVCTGLRVGAQFTGSLIQSGAAKLRTKLKPNETPTVIDPKMKQRVKTASEISMTAVQVTKFLVQQVQFLTDKAVERIAPAIADRLDHGSNPNMRRITQSNGAKQAVQVAKAGIRGVITVVDGLEKAAIVLARELSSATKETIKHKYGEEAGEFTDQSMLALGNTSTAVLHVKRLGYKAIAKGAAKKTVGGVVNEMGERHSHSNFSGMDALPPASPSVKALPAPPPEKGD